jgi:superfamily II DNA or RNA helicase
MRQADPSLFELPSAAEAEPGRKLLACRPFQEKAVNAVLEDFKTWRKVLVVSATATGKTVIASHIIRLFPGTGKRLVLANRRELIAQAREKIHAITGDLPGVEMADEKHWHTDTDSNVIVGSIQTQMSGIGDKKRYMQFDPMEIDLIEIDEAHRAISPGYQEVCNYYLNGNPRLKLFGVTATPDRGDGMAMGRMFDKVSFCYPMVDAIRDGWIVQPKTVTVTVKNLDFSKIRTTAGDLNGAELEAVLNFEEIIHGMATPLLELAERKQTLVFCVGVEHSRRFAEILNRHRPDCARSVDGTTPDEQRKEIFRAYANKEFQYLCNVGVVTEGTDLPGVEVIALCRPTKSRSLFEQMIGRGVRPAANIAERLNDMTSGDERLDLIRLSSKPWLTVYDYAGNAGKHKLIGIADVLGGDYSENVKERAKKIAKKESENGTPSSMFDALDRADAEIKEEIRLKRMQELADARARRHLIAKVEYVTGDVDVFDWYDLRPPKADNRWNAPPLTDRQAMALQRFGVDPQGLTKGQAGTMLGQLVGRITINQSRRLVGQGYTQAEVSGLSVQDASSLIERTNANGGRKVEGLVGFVPGNDKAVLIPSF